MAKIAFEERFWEKVNKEGPVLIPELGECWVWTSPTATNGYGQIHTEYGSPPISSHVASWELHFGEKPAGKWVLHRCDNRLCVRPDHLFLGTHTDNMRDMVAKKRHSNSRKTVCKNNHEFTAENTYNRTNGGRDCRECRRARQAKYMAKVAG